MGNSMSFDRCSVTAKFNVSTTKDLGDLDNLADPTDILNMDFSDSLTNGRAVDQGNALWFDSGTLAASASQDYDFVASLINAFGDTLNLDLIKGIIVKNTSD